MDAGVPDDSADRDRVGSDPWHDAQMAAALLAVDPAGLGGVALRAAAGPVRDRWVALLRDLVDGPVRKVPAGIDEDRLLGGLDLAATLAAGAARHEAGVLAAADGGVVLLAMAERVPAGTAARIAQAMDTGRVGGDAARFGLVLLDEGIGDERVPAVLLERVGLRLDLTSQPLAPVVAEGVAAEAVAAARAALGRVVLPEAGLAALGQTAAALGVGSSRALLLAARAARATAALGGRAAAGQEDVALAARLVLAPRATMMPVAPAPETEADQPPQPDETGTPDDAPERDGSEPDETDPAEGDVATLTDQVLEAARAAIPAGLLAQLAATGMRRAAPAGKSGALVRGMRGRRLPARPGVPRGGARLDLIETLRAAAPWQVVRGGAPPIRVRRDDLRIARRQQRAETTTIFLVDASGSLALNRLGEAKGAVELLLADCYIRRDQVAVVAFRGTGAALLLPPTRSLVRAKRGLAGLPGGGGTPLASGIEAGALLADAVRRRGGTPTLVLLTDGQANVARDGGGGRARAQADALAAAQLVRAAGYRALLIDTSPRPSAAARALAAGMDARYVPLPLAEAGAVSRAVRAVNG